MPHSNDFILRVSIEKELRWGPFDFTGSPTRKYKVHIKDSNDADRIFNLLKETSEKELIELLSRQTIT